jgi:hypothetical protein|tara:strand:- start:184 stop:459 length:276 start_codon:yes stop_codon:yes gene_type:complete
MSRCLDDIFDIQDAILVLEKLKLNSPLYDEEYTKEVMNSKMVVLNDLYEQLESHIETDIQECTEEEVQELYKKRFLDDYDIIEKVRNREDE